MRGCSGGLVVEGTLEPVPASPGCPSRSVRHSGEVCVDVAGPVGCAPCSAWLSAWRGRELLEELELATREKATGVRT